MEQTCNAQIQSRESGFIKCNRYVTNFKFTLTSVSVDSVSTTVIPNPPCDRSPHHLQELDILLKRHRPTL